MQSFIRQEDVVGIGHRYQALGCHLENTDLVGGAKAVLYRSQDLVLAFELAFEIEDCIHNVFDNLGTGYKSFLGHMAYHKDRYV